MRLAPSRPHDGSLIERVMTGDEEAMVALFDRYSHLVYCSALQAAGTPELAEEILHNVFLQLWSMPGQCKPVPPNGIAPWLEQRARSMANTSIPINRDLPKNASSLEGTGLDVIDLDDSFFVGRRSRVYSAERQLVAMQSLAEAFAGAPETILQTLVEAAVEICGAQSSGVSIQDRDLNDVITYHWVATAGQYKRFANAMLPSFPSACGVCLERGRPQFFRVSKAFFDLMGIEAEIVTDGLLIPWQVEEVRGTIWIMSHDREQVFDKDDCRMMVLLANFAAMAVKNQRQQEAVIDHARVTAATCMAHRLAHAINNPLQILTDAVSLAEHNEGDMGDRALAQEISGPLKRLKALVRGLLALPKDVG